MDIHYDIMNFLSKYLYLLKRHLKTQKKLKELEIMY